jgi:hypothetical protein
MRQATCVSMLAFALASSAVTATAGQPVWGLKGGIVGSSIAASGDQAFDASTGAGAAVGAFVGGADERRVTPRIEALLTWRQFNATNVPQPFRVRSRSIEVPLLMRVRVASGRAGRFWVDAGPQIAAITSVTQITGTTRTDISDQIRNVDVAAAVGGELERALGSGAILFGVRAIMGRHNLSESPTRSLESRAFATLIGYRF